MWKLIEALEELEEGKETEAETVTFPEHFFSATSSKMLSPWIFTPNLIKCQSGQMRNLRLRGNSSLPTITWPSRCTPRSIWPQGPCFSKMPFSWLQGHLGSSFHFPAEQTGWVSPVQGHWPFFKEHISLDLLPGVLPIRHLELPSPLQDYEDGWWPYLWVMIAIWRSS